MRSRGLPSFRTSVLAEPALQQLSHVSSRERAPRGLRPHNRIGDGEELSHAGRQRDFGRLTRRAAAPNRPAAAERPAVTSQWRDADQRGDLLPTQATELRQFGQERPAGDRADPRDALQQIVLGPPQGAGAHGLVQITIDPAELALEPANVVGETAPDGAAREAQPILLGDQHLDELAPPRDQGFQALAGLIRQRPGLGADALGKQGQHRRIDGVGLRQLARGAREVAYLSGIRHHHRDAGTGQRRRDGLLVSPGGLEDDQHPAQLAQAVQQRFNAARIVGDLPAIPARPACDIQGRLSDIDPNKYRGSSHETSGAKAARLDPALHDAGLESQATVRARDEQTADDAPAEGRSLRPGARRAIARLWITSSHDAPSLQRYKGTVNPCGFSPYFPCAICASLSLILGLSGNCAASCSSVARAESARPAARNASVFRKPYRTRSR